jgi:cytochrome c oxidase subunit 1
MTAAGLLIGALFFVNHNFLGAIAGGVVMFLGVYFWALEGPGGYHVHPSEEDEKSGGYNKH